MFTRSGKEGVLHEYMYSICLEELLYKPSYRVMGIGNYQSLYMERLYFPLNSRDSSYDHQKVQYVYIYQSDSVHV